MRMGHISLPTPSPTPRLRRSPRRILPRTQRRSRPAPGLEPTVVIQPGGMVELALRELGAVLVRVLPDR